MFIKCRILRHLLTLLCELEAQDSGWQSLLPGIGDQGQKETSTPAQPGGLSRVPLSAFCLRGASCDPVRPTYGGEATCRAQSTISDAKLSRYTVSLTYTHRNNA